MGHSVDYTNAPLYKKRRLIESVGGMATYKMYEDAEKIILKRSIKNMLDYWLWAILGFMYLYLCAVIFLFVFLLDKIANMPWLLVSIAVALIVFSTWECFYLFKEEITILKKEKRVQIRRKGKTQKYLLAYSGTTFQKIYSVRGPSHWCYIVVFHEKALFGVMQKRPEFDRVLEYLISIGFVEIDRRWEYRGDKEN